jgi:SAM-dependent methyltransferase
MLQAHTNAWYDKISETQSGYHYPWKSTLPPDHGEDSFLRILRTELTPRDAVLDAGCGSGEVTNELAQCCHQIVGYDRVARFVDLANRNRRPNATFILHDSKQEGNRMLPVEDRSIDYFISSKGPSHWIADVPRVARGQAKLLMLMPFTGREPEWYGDLPPELKEPGFSKDQLVEDTKSRLKAIGSEIKELQNFEVRESFSDQAEFFSYLTWGKFDGQYNKSELGKVIGKMFSTFGKRGELFVNRCRLIWRSSFDAT